MKIQRFKIENKHKNFNNLDIDFTNCQGVAAFIGDNASGKSNLLEAFSAIFKNIYLDEKDEFDYFLEYTTYNNNNVRITSSSKGRIYAVDGNPLHEIKSFLPKRVVAIYSGEEDRLWQKYYAPVYLDYVDSIAKNSNLDYPRMFLLNKFYWHIILLSLLISDADDVKEFIKSKLGITKVNNIKFKFYKSRYENYKNNPVLSLIKRLDSKENYTLEEFKETLKGDYSTSEIHSGQFVLGFEPTDIFQALYIAFTPKDHKIIDEIEITFNDSIKLSALSEGQKKLLLIKAALEFASSEDTLILLDEPDAHIHIGNKQEVVKVFEPYKGTRQIILTTHSPTLTQTLNDDNVFMLTKGELIKKDKQFIISALTKEYWNKQNQNLFLASDKKIILLVEGKHDLTHIENAFKKYKSDYPDLDFDIFSLKGEKNIAPMLIGLRDAELNNDKIYIGIYDNDKAGQDSINKGGYRPVDGASHRKLLENGYIHSNYFAVMLPKPIGFNGDCTIENMYDCNKFEVAFTSAVTQSQGHFQNKSIEDVTEDIKLKAKNFLSQQSATFLKEDFKYFIPLFDAIQQIKEKNIRVVSTSANNESKTPGKKVNKTIKLVNLTTQKGEYAESDHFKNRTGSIKQLYEYFRDGIMSLDKDINIIAKKDYIAFKKKSNIVDITIQTKQLKMWINLKKGNLNDPKNITNDVSGKGHWGNGDYEIIIKDRSKFDDILALIKQAL